VVKEALCHTLSPGERGCCGLKKQVVRPMRNSLQVRECGEEVSYPRRSLVAATKLIEFYSGLLLKPQKRGGATDGLCDGEGVYSLGGTGMWGMRFCE
jgi:hypothetical protein